MPPAPVKAPSRTVCISRLHCFIARVNALIPNQSPAAPSQCFPTVDAFTFQNKTPKAPPHKKKTQVQRAKSSMNFSSQSPTSAQRCLLPSNNQSLPSSSPPSCDSILHFLFLGGARIPGVFSSPGGRGGRCGLSAECVNGELTSNWPAALMLMRERERGRLGEGVAAVGAAAAGCGFALQGGKGGKGRDVCCTGV